MGRGVKWLDEPSPPGAYRERFDKCRIDIEPVRDARPVRLRAEPRVERAQRELGLGTALTDDPDRALEPDIASMIMFRGMAEGWFTGKKLSDYITLQKSDFVNAQRIVNGTDYASDIASIAAEYDAALLAEGYGVDSPDQPDPVPDPTPGLDEMIARYLALEAWAVEQGYEPPAVEA